MRFSFIKKNKAFHKSSMKVGGQEVVANGDGTSKSVGSACSGDGWLFRSLFSWKRLALEWKKISPL